MARLAAMNSRRPKSLSLGEHDIIRLSLLAEDFDAVYGAALDLIAPAIFIKLSERPHAA